jgi:dipeptidyl aminopeptidase/acylaminoacyl peptidase
MKNRQRSVVITALAVLAVALVLYKLGVDRRRPPPEFSQILAEVMSVESATRPPFPDPTGSLLACLSGNQYGRGLSFVDLKTLQRSSLPGTNDIKRIAGWSPDGRHLAFEQKPALAKEALRPVAARPLVEDRQESWLTIFDRISNTSRRLTTETPANERFFVWLTTNTYFFSRDSDDEESRGTFWGKLNERQEVKVAGSLRDIVAMSERTAAYLESSNIYSFELPPAGAIDGKVPPISTNQLSSFEARGFDSLRWLRYQPERGTFLFCSRPADSIWRYLFQFNPIGNQLVQLNHEDTYNGQWLEAGAGYAYVGNTNNSFFLAVRTSDPAGHTNLFTKGSVANYTTSPMGDKLYATASVGIEPQGIWEYALKERTLRQVMPGSPRPFVKTILVEPEERRIKSFDGLEVPCFIFEPVQKSNSTSPQPLPRRKCPAIIHLPARTSQFQRTFEPRSQLMANLGFYFMAVNYRGCDGYGRAYATMEDPAGAARDVLAAYNELIKNPDVDPRNVFLWTSSSGGLVALELLATQPKLWRGVALGSPPGWPANPWFDPAQFPPLIITTGDKDEARPSLKEFEKWVAENGLDARVVVLANEGHIMYNSADIQLTWKLITEFVFSHLQK